MTKSDLVEHGEGYPSSYYMAPSDDVVACYRPMKDFVGHAYAPRGATYAYVWARGTCELNTFLFPLM